MLREKLHIMVSTISRIGVNILLACILAISLLPVAAYADNDDGANNENSSEAEDSESPDDGSLVLLLPTISSPELLKSLIDENDPSLNNSSTSQTFDFEGVYDGQIVADAQYEQFSEITRAAIASNVVVALAKEAGTLLLVDCTLTKRGNASNIDEAVSYGTNAVMTAVGQASHALALDCLLDSQAVASSGFAAIDRAIILAQNVAIKTASLYSNALLAAYGGTILANDIEADLSGEDSPIINAGAGEGYISLTNSTLTATGENSPIVSSDGRVEIDDVAGVSAAAQIAWIHDEGAVLVHGSKLESWMTERDSDDPEANAIALYRENPVNLDSLQGDTIFQATDSVLSSSLKTGSLFYLTNTRAKIFLSNTALDFDENSVRLLTAMGNNRNGWGTQGSNGARATVTAQDQKLKGDIVVDSQSSVDFFLLNGTTWRGGALNISGSQTSLLSDKLNITIDRNSSWVVTKKSTVTNLNLANGGRLIDAWGKSVKIVDSNGFTLVDGASDISVTVTGGFSTTVRTTADNVFEGYQIERASIDEAFGLNTAYGSNGSRVYSADELRTLEMANRIRNWFREL